jgi:hypothetical protein
VAEWSALKNLANEHPDVIAGHVRLRADDNPAAFAPGGRIVVRPAGGGLLLEERVDFDDTDPPRGLLSPADYAALTGKAGLLHLEARPYRRWRDGTRKLTGGAMLAPALAVLVALAALVPAVVFPPPAAPGGEQVAQVEAWLAEHPGPRAVPDDVAEAVEDMVAERSAAAEHHEQATLVPLVVAVAVAAVLLLHGVRTALGRRLGAPARGP